MWKNICLIAAAFAAILSCAQSNEEVRAEDLPNSESTVRESPPANATPAEGVSGLNIHSDSTMPAISSSAATSTPADALAGNAFDLALYSKVAALQAGNLFISPYSVNACLAMTSLGARGATAAQFDVLFHDGLSREAREKSWHDSAMLSLAFKNAPVPQPSTSGEAAIPQAASPILRIANAIWTLRGAPLAPDFVKSVKDDFNATIEQADFAGAAEPTRAAINAWVEKQTEQKNKDLIPAGALDSRTRMVLVNAIYFLGTWAEKFDAAGTEPTPFHISPEKTVQAPTMINKAHYGYAVDGGTQLLRMNYAGNALSMLIALPAENSNLGSLEKSLDAAQLARWSGLLHDEELTVYLPKFRITSTLTLNDTLRQLGLTDAFDTSRADFSGIDGARDLTLSAVFHKAYVDVDEKGTEAAAATGAVISLTMARSNQIYIHANRPFLFFIQENATGRNLFMGRVVDPTINGE